MNQSEPFVRLLLTVLDVDSCDVAFEPEGAVVTLRRGDALAVELHGPGSGVVEVSFDPKGISIGAWSGASTTARDRTGQRLDI
jgi:hypothetical protein